MKAATSQDFQNPIFFGSFSKRLFRGRANRCALPSKYLSISLG